MFFLGRVCVPIDASKVDSFDPMIVPTITQLTDEIDKVFNLTLSSRP
jgi:hypothetical protein